MAIQLTWQPKPFWGWFIARPMMPRQRTSMLSRQLINCPLNSGPLKTEYGSLRQRSGTIRTGQTGPRGGCIKSLWRLSRNSLALTIVVARSHHLHRPLWQIPNGSFQKQLPPILSARELRRRRYPACSLSSKSTKAPSIPFHLPAQPVDATQVLNLSAGVSNAKVFRGRSFS